ncbi:MAG: DNA/RNA nuclease SfsA [Clostridiales bacterium]
MKYNNITSGIFVERTNRFIARVKIDEDIEIVHVRNTGRCKEILIEGTRVYLEKSNNPDRKTKYSIICAYKNDLLINIDSQVPNQVVYEAIKGNLIKNFNNLKYIKREVTFKNSRFDIYYETDIEKGFIEVKGVTLEENGISKFPDAPTKRGVKHLNEMIEATKEGYKGHIFFLIQMKSIKKFTPNYKTDKEFSNTLYKASKNGVDIIAYNTIVEKDRLSIKDKVEVFF